MRWAVGEREHAAIAALPARAWTPAIEIDGEPREHAAVAELTGLLAPANDNGAGSDDRGA